MRLPFSNKGVSAKTIAQMVGGVDYFVIGIALLIFGYGIYELVISDLDPGKSGSIIIVIIVLFRTQYFRYNIM